MICIVAIYPRKGMGLYMVWYPCMVTRLGCIATVRPASRHGYVNNLDDWSSNMFSVQPAKTMPRSSWKPCLTTAAGWLTRKPNYVQISFRGLAISPGHTGVLIFNTLPTTGTEEFANIRVDVTRKEVLVSYLDFCLCRSRGAPPVHYSHGKP